MRREVKGDGGGGGERRGGGGGRRGGEGEEAADPHIKPHEPHSPFMLHFYFLSIWLFLDTDSLLDWTFPPKLKTLPKGQAFLPDTGKAEMNICSLDATHLIKEGVREWAGWLSHLPVSPPKLLGQKLRVLQ